MSSTRTALIVGASRGLGLLLAAELARRGWLVLATVRSQSAGLETAVERSGGKISVVTLDMLDTGSLARLHDDLSGQRLDLLFVNGAINRSFGSIAEASTAEFIDVMTSNALAPLRVIDTFRDLVADGGTVGVMSSEQGSISRNDEDGFEVYKASKAALNQLMRSYANRYSADGHVKLLIDPGHNRTSLGGDGAPFDPADSVARVANVLEATHDSTRIAFLDRDGAVVPW